MVQVIKELPLNFTAIEKNETTPTKDVIWISKEIHPLVAAQIHCPYNISFGGICML